MREQFFEEVLGLARGIKGIVREESARLKFSPSQMSTMYILHLLGPCTMGDLAEQLELSHGAVTAIVDRLLGLGMVVRSQSEKDRRVIKVCLSPKTEAIHEEIMARMRQELNGILELLALSEQQEVERGIELFSKAFKIYEGNPRERSVQIAK